VLISLKKSLIQYRKEILSLFQCQQSGNCCTCPGYVYITDQDKHAISTHLKQSINTLNKSIITTKNGWSLISSTNHRPRCFLDSQNKCQIYPVRPRSCKSYPNWDSIWESDQSLTTEQRTCPGLKRAITQFKSSEHYS